MKFKIKDYCSYFPDILLGKDISYACKLHDNICGMRGSYNPLTTIKPFYNKLIECWLSKKINVAITIGGTLWYLIKYPYLIGKRNNMIKTHEHSIITAIVVSVACIFGVGLYALLLLAGFWAGREHSQAEYRFMKLKGISRSKLGFFDGFRKEAWNKDSLLNDLILPIVIGLLMIGVVIWQ